MGCSFPWGKISIICTISIQCWYNVVIFFPKFAQNTSHGPPIRVRYGVSFVGSNSDIYSASVAAVMYAIWCYIGWRYNNTWLYWLMIENKNIFPCFLKTIQHSDETSWYNNAITVSTYLLLYMGQVTELWPSCYLVLLSIDSKTM